MKTFFRFFTLMLVALITATLLTGCGGKGKSRDNPVGPKLDTGSSDSEIARSERHLKIRAALDKGKAPEAEKLALKAVEKRPEDAEARFLLAKSLIAQNQLVSARDHLEKAISLLPDNTAYRRVLGEILDQQAMEFIKKETPEKAVTAWKRCIELKFKPRQVEASLAEAYAMHGEQLAKASRFDEAEAVYREAMALLPENPQPGLQLAEMFIANDRLLEAQLLLKELLNQNPKSEEGRVAYAKLLQRMGDVRGAMAQTEKTLLIAPGNKEALSLRKDLENQVPTSSAGDSPARIMATDEPDAILLEQLTALESAGNLAGQAKLLRQILKANPETPWAQLRAAQVAERLGNATEALSLTRNYLITKADDPRARFVEARCLQLMGDLDGSLAILQDLEKALPDNVQIFNETGQIMAKMGKFAEAQVSWNKALKVDPENAAALFNFGQLTMEQGKSKEATDFFDRALRKEPQNLKYLYFAGLNLKQSGQADEAKALWEKAKATMNLKDPYGVRILRALGEKVPASAQTVSQPAPATDLTEAVAPTPTTTTTQSGAPTEAQPDAQPGVSAMGNSFTVVKPAAPAPGTENPRYREALDAARAGRYDEAIEGFKVVVQDSPNSFNAVMNLGNAYMATSRHGDAAAMYMKGLRLNPKNAHALKALSHVYDQLGLRANAQGLQGSAAAAGATPQRSNPRAYEPVVKAFLAQGLSEEALPLITSAVEENPEAPEFLALQGEVLHRLGKSDLAEISFRKAIDLDKQTPLAYLKLGDMYADQQKKDQALTEYQAALKAKFIEPDTMFDLFDRFKALGKLTEATDVINKLKGMNLSDQQMEKLRARQG